MIYNALHEVLNNPSKKIKKEELKSLIKTLKKEIKKNDYFKK
jgi:fructose-1-phosphate kinase PfkB-like protein